MAFCSLSQRAEVEGRSSRWVTLGPGVEEDLGVEVDMVGVSSVGVGSVWFVGWIVVWDFCVCDLVVAQRIDGIFQGRRGDGDGIVLHVRK